MDPSKINLREITLFVYDTAENFEASKYLLGVRLFKNVVNVENFEDFDTELKRLGPDEWFFLAVHVFYTSGIKGIKSFVVSHIEEVFHPVQGFFISDGDSKDIKNQMVNANINTREIYKYHQVQEHLTSGYFKPFCKRMLANTGGSKPDTERAAVSEVGEFDYAIVTALEQSEMEHMLPLLKTQGKISSNHLIEYGTLAEKPELKVVYGTQHNTGMIDAAILASEMIVRFRPRILIMPGVLGGKPNGTNIGDIIIPSKVFTIDKGKISKGEFKPELEVSNSINPYVKKIERVKRKIERFIQDNDHSKRQVQIHFEPIACVRQVIDEDGYFESKLVRVERKTMALEMER
ncbi:MAG TPA: hypothetical protein VGD40_23150 [Chryseosolibacter sp.]